jgi:multiple antibiotic resistance protein
VNLPFPLPVVTDDTIEINKLKKHPAMPEISQIFTLLFLMLGPFKILVPFVRITKNADQKLARQIAVRAILYSVIALTIAAFLGQKILSNFGIPIPILTLSGGIILFLVALLNVIQQFDPPKAQEESAGTPTLQVATYPLAFPTIVTPYGIAAVIVFNAISPDLSGKLIVGAIVVGIMVLNFLVMLFARRLFKPLAIILAILGAILGVIQVAVGAKIIYNSLTALLTS